MATLGKKHRIDYRRLGGTGLLVSEMGMGCADIGGGLFRPRDEAEVLRTLGSALDAGINFFDTSDSYGHGESERLLGKAFKGKRHHVIIATKGGETQRPLGRFALANRHVLGPVRGILRPLRRRLSSLHHAQKRHEFSPGYLRSSVERSLVRLQTDYVDLYQLHNPPPAVLEAGDFLTTLESLKAEGKIRHYGVSCAQVEDALICMRYSGIATIQIPMSLIKQEAIGTVLPLAIESGVGVIAREPLAFGLLTDAPRESKAERLAKSRREFHEQLERAEEFRSLVCNGRTMAQAALRFALSLTGVSVVIPGMETKWHFEENVGTMAAPAISSAEMARARAMTG